MIYLQTVSMFLGLSKRPIALKNKNIKIPDNVIEEYFQKTGIRIDPHEFTNREEKQGRIFKNLTLIAIKWRHTLILQRKTF